MNLPENSLAIKKKFLFSVKDDRTEKKEVIECKQIGDGFWNWALEKTDPTGSSSLTILLKGTCLSGLFYPTVRLPQIMNDKKRASTVIRLVICQFDKSFVPPQITQGENPQCPKLLKIEANILTNELKASQR